MNNNPLRYTDPSGHMMDDGCDTEGCNLTPLQKAIDAQKLKKHEQEAADRRCAKGNKAFCSGYYKDDEDWKQIADTVTPTYASGSKTSWTATAAFNAGGEWGYSLITTKYGDAQFYYEHGLAVTVGPNVTVSSTHGQIFGLETAADYVGGSTSASASVGVDIVSASVGGWRSDDKKLSGIDTSKSVGLSLMPVSLNGGHTTAEPVGQPFTLPAPLLTACRLLGGCGR